MVIVFDILVSNIGKHVQMVETSNMAVWIIGMERCALGL